jgi:activator of Hsp90 ATPase-like protein
LDTPDFPETTVVWELEEIGPNKTKVELTHLDFTGKEKGLTSIESHNEGWTDLMSKLANYCTVQE